MNKTVCKILAGVMAAACLSTAGLSTLAQGTQTALLTQNHVRDVRRYGFQMLDRNVKRTIPAASGKHEASYYPGYGSNAVDDLGKKKEILAEAGKDDVVGSIFRYDKIGADGTLYWKNAATGEKLVRHYAGINNYGGSIPDDAMAVSKKMTLRMRDWGNVLTGLYAPAGEVIKIEVENFNPKKAPAVTIGLNTQRNHNVIMPEGKSFNRMPRMWKYLNLTEAVSYVGNPLGGPIYIDKGSLDSGQDVTLTITGAVEYPHFIHGTTTAEEYEILRTTAPGPFFDMETPRGLRISSPLYPMKNVTGERMAKTADFWDKAIGLSYQFGWGGSNPNNENTTVFTIIYDHYIAAGYAVNFGGSYCTNPVEVAQHAFNIEGLMRGGEWTTLHEMNHTFEGWGARNPNTDIGNNAITALTYQLYTNIDSFRSESSALSGWNFSQNAYLSARKVKAETEGHIPHQFRDNLEMYTPLQFSFGHEKFLEFVYESKKRRNQGQDPAGSWLALTSELSGYDMTFFLRDVLNFDNRLGADYVSKAQQFKDAPGKIYIPNGLLYASGYVYEGEEAQRFGEYVASGRPFYIPIGKEKTLNLNTTENGGYLAVPMEVSAQILEVKQHNVTSGAAESTSLKAPGEAALSTAQGGTVVWKDGMNLVYTPPVENDNVGVEPDFFDVKMRLTINGQNNGKEPSVEYKDKYMDVIYRLSFMQDTGGAHVRFYTTNGSTTTVDAAQTFIANGTLATEFNTSGPGFTIDNNAYGGRVNNSIAIMEGKVIVPTAGEHPFHAHGDDKFKLFLSTNQDELPSDTEYVGKDPSMETERYTGRLDINRPVTIQTTENNQPVYFKAFVLNTGGSGRFQLGWKNESGSIVNIPDANTVQKDAPGSNRTAVRTDYVTEKLYSYTPPSQPANPIFKTFDSKLNAVEAWDDSRNQTLERHGSSGPIGAMVDGNMNSHMHSRVQWGNNFQSSFTFERTEPAQKFNIIEIMGRPDGRGRFTQYELYASDNKEELLRGQDNEALKVASGRVEYRGRYGYIYIPQGLTQKYFKIKSLACGQGNGAEYYINIFNVRLGEGVVGKRNTVVPQQMEGWNVNTLALARNSSGLNETDSPDANGQFEFNGTGVVMYAAKGPEYGVMEVRMDDGEWQRIDLYADASRYAVPVFFKANLEQTNHTLQFRRIMGKVNVDYFDVQTTPANAIVVDAPPKPMTRQTQEEVPMPQVVFTANTSHIEIKSEDEIVVFMKQNTAKAQFMVSQQKATYILGCYNEDNALLTHKLLDGEPTRTTDFSVDCPQAASAKLFVLESDGSYRLIKSFSTT